MPRRTSGVLSIAYVDVVGLKAANDEHGHAAGDALLQRVVGTIRSHLRSYDSIVRLGGDEFLCVMSGTTIEDARARFDVVQTVLGRAPIHARSRSASARSRRATCTADLVERADSDMPPSPRAPLRSSVAPVRPRRWPHSGCCTAPGTTRPAGTRVTGTARGARARDNRSGASASRPRGHVRAAHPAGARRRWTGPRSRWWSWLTRRAHRSRPLVAAARPVSLLVHLCPRMGAFELPDGAPGAFRDGLPMPSGRAGRNDRVAVPRPPSR